VAQIVTSQHLEVLQRRFAICGICFQLFKPRPYLPAGAISEPVLCWKFDNRQANPLAHHMGAYRQLKAGAIGSYLLGKGSSLQPAMQPF
jgi:hypothetical protein